MRTGIKAMRCWFVPCEYTELLEKYDGKLGSFGTATFEKRRCPYCGDEITMITGDTDLEKTLKGVTKVAKTTAKKAAVAKKADK